MVSPLTALFAVSAGFGLMSAKAARENREELRRELQREARSSDDDGEPLSDPRTQLDMDQKDSLERLVNITERNNPQPESRDATQSGTFELGPGDSAIIEARPENGYVLFVDRVYTDRRNDHEYSISIGGVDVAETHEWTGNPPRRLPENDDIIVTVTNDSSASSTIDFVLDMYGVESEACGCSVSES